MEINVNNTFFTGKFLIHLPSVDSTNNYAKELIAKSSPIDGTVILADEQLAGRGQTGNAWLAEANKNLTFSLIFHTHFLRAAEQFWLNMAVSLGVKYAVSSMLNKLDNPNNSHLPTEGLLAKIKWPNDIYSKDKKIGGILIENTISGMFLKYSVVGIGLNVNQAVFPAEINATSFKNELNKETDHIQLLETILVEVEKYFLLLRERKFERLKSDYVDSLFRFEEWSLYKKKDNIFEGKIIDVQDSGCLMMETKSGTEIFDFKEISFVIT